VEENRATSISVRSERSLHIPTAYENTKAWRKLNKDKVNEQARRYRERHPDKVKEISDRYRATHADQIRQAGAAAMRAKRAVNPEAQRERMRQFKERREAQRVAVAGRPRQSCCELCQADGPTVWDHSHVTGEFRGWICDRCNKTLGMVRDDKELLRAMADYLEASDGNTESVSA